MKNKVIAAIAIIAVVCISWIVVITTASSKSNRIDDLKHQIEANIEVKTYKNTLPLYEELIKVEPGKIKWQLGLADAYLELDQLGNYKKQCEKIVSVFPNNTEGHLMLIKYYAAAGKDDKVIDVYNLAPTAVQKNDDFLSVYKKSEWKYKFLSKGYSSIGTCSGDTYVIEYNGVYGYKSKDISGEIAPKFEKARPFIEDYAAVYKDNEWYFIDGAGDKVMATKEKIEDMYSFSEQFAAAKIDGKYGYVDSNFKKYSFEYEDATNFYNGIAAAKKNGKWGLIDKQFNEVAPFDYEDIVRDDANICSRKGIVFVVKSGKYYMLDLNGKKVIDETLDGAHLFYSDYAAVKKGDKWGFIDREGNTVIDFTYDDASSFASGIAAIKKGEQWGCINADGEIILDTDYEGAKITSDNGVVVIKVGELFRFVQFIKFDN